MPNRRRSLSQEPGRKKPSPKFGEGFDSLAVSVSRWCAQAQGGVARPSAVVGWAWLC